MDVLAIVGVCVAFLAIIGGNFLEGGQLSALLNTPAGIIVLGGTLGAVILQTPKSRLIDAARMVRWVWLPPVLVVNDGIKKMLSWSTTARKEGLLGLENAAEREKDPFARKGLELLIDGGEPQVIRHVMENELSARMQRDLAAASVFKSMGGYAPTIGIIGAVMGLIHVMGSLADPHNWAPALPWRSSQRSTASASANLVFLPIADCSPS